jgi:hypothetical protein
VKQVVLSLALLPFLGMAGRAQVLFTNFGPGLTYKASNYSGPGGTACTNFALATRFQPSVSAFFQDAKLALGLFQGTNQVSVYLETDGPAGPGTVIEGPINVSLSTAPAGSVITATSSLHPFLLGGTSYWLVWTAMNADTCADSFWNSTGDVSNGSNFAFDSPGTPTGPWNFFGARSTRPAFQIDGTAITTGVLQIRYASNLNQGDSVVNITNTGDSATANLTGTAQNNIDGSVCVNIYAFAADEQEVACCSCLVTPNALWSASVKTALLNSTLTSSFPNEVVLKLISTAPNVGANNAQSCNPATVTAGGLATGLAAWGTSLHGVPTATGPTFQLAETPFLPASLSNAELQRDVQECQFIQVLGSGQFGICKGCSNVGLGAAAQ